MEVIRVSVMKPTNHIEIATCCADMQAEWMNNNLWAPYVRDSQLCIDGKHGASPAFKYCPWCGSEVVYRTEVR